MLFRPLILLFTTWCLVGCDKIPGMADPKTKDAQAVGYACRISKKTPEVCMKENEAQSPSAVLEGWRAADVDIQEKNLDPTMSGLPLKPPKPEKKPKKDDAEATDEAAADGEKTDSAESDTKH